MAMYADYTDRFDDLSWRFSNHKLALPHCLRRLTQ